MAALPDEAFLPLTPDWVCEVLSPSTERIDRTRKLRMYGEAGVGHAWLVNPRERTLEVLRLREGAWTIVQVLTGIEPVPVEPFEAIDLDLAAISAEPSTPQSTSPWRQGRLARSSAGGRQAAPPDRLPAR